MFVWKCSSCSNWWLTWQTKSQHPAKVDENTMQSQSPSLSKPLLYDQSTTHVSSTTILAPTLHMFLASNNIHILLRLVLSPDCPLYIVFNASYIVYICISQINWITHFNRNWILFKPLFRNLLAQWKDAAHPVVLLLKFCFTSKVCHSNSKQWLIAISYFT